MALEEVERIVTDDPLFADYLELATVVLRARGTDLLVGPALAEMVVPDGCERTSKVCIVRPRSAQAAAMLALNLQTLRHDESVTSRRSKAEFDAITFFDLDVLRLVSPGLHDLNQMAFGLDERGGDPSDQPAALEDQLRWLRSAGFVDVDCFWKWMELALVGGAKAPGRLAAQTSLTSRRDRTGQPRLGADPEARRQ